MHNSLDVVLYLLLKNKLNTGGTTAQLTDDDAIKLLAESGVVLPIALDDGTLLTENAHTIYVI